MVPSPHDAACPETRQKARFLAAQVEQIVTDVIELADTDTLDLQSSRAVVQEVLDTLNERQAR